MAALPLDTSVQAEYADGFILDETELGDVSPYNPEQNVFRAILEKQPEAHHGKMVRFSVFYNNQRHDIDWLQLPDNARPIRFRDGSFAETVHDDGTLEVVSGFVGGRFGYQFTDNNGKNQEFIKEL